MATKTLLFLHLFAKEDKKNGNRLGREKFTLTSLISRAELFTVRSRLTLQAEKINKHAYMKYSRSKFNTNIFSAISRRGVGFGMLNVLI
jgi:hypothetical protein